MSAYNDNYYQLWFCLRHFHIHWHGGLLLVDHPTTHSSKVLCEAHLSSISFDNSIILFMRLVYVHSRKRFGWLAYMYNKIALVKLLMAVHDGGFSRIFCLLEGWLTGTVDVVDREEISQKFPKCVIVYVYTHHSHKAVVLVICPLRTKIYFSVHYSSFSPDPDFHSSIHSYSTSCALNVAAKRTPYTEMLGALFSQ